MSVGLRARMIRKTGSSSVLLKGGSLVFSSESASKLSGARCMSCEAGGIHRAPTCPAWIRTSRATSPSGAGRVRARFGAQVQITPCSFRAVIVFGRDPTNVADASYSRLRLWQAHPLSNPTCRVRVPASPENRDLLLHPCALPPPARYH